MNKKLNTIFFVLGATLFNILLMLGIVRLGAMLLNLIFSRIKVSDTLIMFSFIIVILAAIGITLRTYHFIVRKLAKKWNMDKYFGKQPWKK
jgi:hypothetical protein